MAKTREWVDLPKTKNCFTVRNAAMIDLNSLEPIRYYSANTKIAVVQKLVTDRDTYYRTNSAKEGGLDWAFTASAFGLPNEIAPSAPSVSPIRVTKPEPRINKPAEKQKGIQKILPEDGEARGGEGWLKRLFGRRNG